MAEEGKEEESKGERKGDKEREREKNGEGDDRDASVTNEISEIRSLDCGFLPRRSILLWKIL